VLLFGDSSLDLVKHNAAKSFALRKGFVRLQQRLQSAAGLSADAMSCAGAPLYDLCCVSCCVPPPRKALVVSMGGNDFVACPCPTCLPGIGSCCPCVVYSAWKCFLACRRGSAKIVWLTDPAISGYYNKKGKWVVAYGMPCAQCCGFRGEMENPYFAFQSWLMKSQAGAVVRPRFKDPSAARQWVEKNNRDAPEPVGPTPGFEYEWTRNPHARRPELIVVDHRPALASFLGMINLDDENGSGRANPGTRWTLDDRAKLFGMEESLAKLMTGTDGGEEGAEGEASALYKEIWTEWLLELARVDFGQGSASGTGGEVGGGGEGAALGHVEGGKEREEGAGEESQPKRHSSADQPQVLDMDRAAPSSPYAVVSDT
jgi:hypothetical protein